MPAVLHLDRVLFVSATLTVAALAACSSEGDQTAASPRSPAADAGDAPAPGEEDAGAEKPTTSPLVTDRPFAVKEPSGYDGSAALPLVVLLHGYTGTSKVVDAYFELNALVDEKQFLLALPDGTKDPGGKQFWNASDACCDFFGTGVDDVAYLGAVIADVKARFNVDAKRVFVVGHSNGGFMAHRLACERSGEIAAIVSLAGGTYTSAAKCKATEPVAVLQVHGDADETVLYEGGSFFAGSPAYPSAEATVGLWATKNGCNATLTKTAEKLDLDTGLAGEETTVARHACTKGAAELWTIAGGAHIPDFGSTWAARIYAFLEAHPKP